MSHKASAGVLKPLCHPVLVLLVLGTTTPAGVSHRDQRTTGWINTLNFSVDKRSRCTALRSASRQPMLERRVLILALGSWVTAVGRFLFAPVAQRARKSSRNKAGHAGEHTRNEI
jgi:hypothetical protein